MLFLVVTAFRLLVVTPFPKITFHVLTSSITLRCQESWSPASIGPQTRSVVLDKSLHSSGSWSPFLVNDGTRLYGLGAPEQFFYSESCSVLNQQEEVIHMVCLLYKLYFSYICQKSQVQMNDIWQEETSVHLKPLIMHCRQLSSLVCVKRRSVLK